MRKDLENSIVTLHDRGWSQRRLARDLDVSRNTVRAVLERAGRLRGEGHSALPAARSHRSSRLDDFDDLIRAKLAEFPDITAVRLHEDLREQGFDGSYTIVKDRLRAIRPEPKVEPARRIETGPGEQGQQDWSPYTIPFTEAEPREVQCFSLVLCFSRRQYIHFCEHQDFYTLIRQHVAAFERFGGVPREILYDRQRTVVLGRECGRDIYNPRFLAFATYYRFRPHALPSRKPKWKGKVEKPFQYVEGNCLNARRFRDLDDLNRHARWWMDHTGDPHRHRITGKPPIERFAEEADHLRPLPARPYDTAEVGYRVVDRNGLVSWDGTPYAVPYEHVLDIVVVRACEDELIVYGGDLTEIARHERMPHSHREPVGEGTYHPRKPGRTDIDALIGRLGTLHEAGAQFAAGVCRQQRYRGEHLARVLAMQERYALDDVVAALERAVRYGAYDARVVERILEATATPRVLPDTSVAEAARRRLRDALDHQEVRPRELAAYARAIRGEDPSEVEE